MKYILQKNICIGCTPIFNCNNPKCKKYMLLDTKHCSDACKPVKCHNPGCDKLIYRKYCLRTCPPKFCANPVCMVKFHHNAALRTKN